MQMRERKYIRFDFTQALHTRATRAERRDYRIIARTWASDHSTTRALAHAVHSLATAHVSGARSFFAAADAKSLDSDFAHILRWSPRLSLARAEAMHRARRTGLKRLRRRENQEHSLRRAYQIETMRTRIAIEFFLVDSMKFLSLIVAIADFSTRVAPRITRFAARHHAIRRA
jgi:hypothetical protein